MNKYEVEDSQKHITALWGKNGHGHYTRQEEIYMKYLKLILPNFAGGKVIEVGPGTGKFALMICQKYSISEYTILDIEKNIDDSKKTLESVNIPKKFIKSQDYEQCFNNKYDLFVSNMCLSEVPEYYRNGIADNIFGNCQNILIIDGDNENPSFNVWLKNKIGKSFDTVVKETEYKSCIAVGGNIFKHHGI